ncbi:uncharacterized protein TNCV_4619961 [Trichonephila clavipes]|nr:uncharacterized protein TNCV_4619961 [Trichonephila clavipes]
MDASIRWEQTKKVLGMAWQTLDDCLTLDTKGLLEFVSINENTKRFMLQTIGKIFDPLGLLSPFTIRIKMSHTRTLDKKVTWDEILPCARKIITSKRGWWHPEKAVTLPRLELLGALVAARLSSRVQKSSARKRRCKVFHWTDSKIVLFWIKGSSKRWKQFVANRVQEISKLTDPDSWFHCSGQDNPSEISCLGT